MPIKKHCERFMLLIANTESARYLIGHFAQTNVFVFHEYNYTVDDCSYQYKKLMAYTTIIYVLLARLTCLWETIEDVVHFAQNI